MMSGCASTPVVIELEPFSILCTHQPCAKSTSMPRHSSASSKTVQTPDMQNLKQGTLSFTSAKRANSAPNAKLQQKPAVTEKAGKKRVETPVEAQNDTKPAALLEISDEESTTAVEVTVPAKRTRASAGTKVRSSSRITKQAPLQLLQSEKQNPFPEGIGRGHLDIEDKAGRYRKYYHEVRSKTGHMHPSKHARLTVNPADFISFAFSPLGGSE